MSLDRSAAEAGWRDHLLSGGTHMWSDSVAEGNLGQGPVPAAANLEVLRRLNLRGTRVDGEAVLNAPRTGRGRVAHRLPWPPGLQDPTAPPPEGIPSGELNRVIADVLAHLLLSRPAPDVKGVRRARVHVYGAPVSAAEAGARLRPRLWRRWTPGAVVLAPPLPELLCETWSARVQQGAVEPWPRFVAASAQSLPPAARLGDLVREARLWHQPRRLHVVLDPSSVDVRRLLGAVRAPGEPVFRRIQPLAVELTRMVNRSASTAPAPARKAVRDLLVRHLPEAVESLTVPPRLFDPLRIAASEALAEARREGAVIHGDPDEWVAAVERWGPTRLLPDSVLRIGLSTLESVLKEAG